MLRHIQVKATKPRIQYVADGTRREFVYPFAVFAQASLEVYLDATKQSAGFVVNGIGESNGGSVLFSEAPSTGVVVTVRRQLVVERTSDFQESGQFRAKIINDELDYLTAAIQQVEAEAERSIRLEPADLEATLTLPSASARAGKAIVFDDEGNLTAKPVDWFASQAAKLSLDTIKEGSANTHFTLSEKAKLSGIEEGAQANPRPIAAEEKSTGVEMAARTFSARDVKDMVALHAPAASLVQSVHGRTGAVTAQRGDYSASQIDDTAEKVIMTAAERETLARLADTASSSTYGSDDIRNESSVEGSTVSAALEALHSLSATDSSWQEPVLDILAAPPGSPETGARYLVDAWPTGDWAGHAQDIATWSGVSWTFVTPARGWTLIALDESAEYRFAAAKWSATGGFISADQIEGDIDYQKLGRIDSGRLLGRAAPDQGNAQQIAVSHGLELTADGDLRLSGATAGSTARSFYGRDTAGAYGFNDIVPNDIKGVAAARLLGNACGTAGPASEIPIGTGSAGSIPTLSDADGRYLRRSFADSTTTVDSVAADDVLALNDTSADGAPVRAPVSALPFLPVGQKGSANGVGSLDSRGRQPTTEAADGAAEERAFAVTSATYTVARRVLIARDGCNEIALTAAAGAYKNIYISNEKTSGSLIIRAVAGENINGLAAITLSTGQSVGLVVVDGSPPTSWKAEISAAVSPPRFPLTIVSNRGHVSNVAATSTGGNRDVLFRLAYWTTKRSAVSGLRLVYANMGMQATGETDGLATMYPRASVEYGGVARRVYFNGRREGVVEPGGILISDPVGIRIPPNTQFWIKSLARTANAGEQYYQGYTTRTTLGEGFVTSATALDTPGALASAQTSGMWPVAAVLGITEEADPPSCVIIGSSSAWGHGENFESLTAPADRGYLARFVSTNFGYSVLAAGSQSAAQWVADPSRRLAFLAAVRPSIVIAQLGTNDIGDGNSFDGVRDNLLALWQSIANLGIKVYPTTFTPRTTSTDAWATVEYQTVCVSEAVRVQVNDFIRSTPAPCSGFLEVADVAETARNSGKWKVAGGAWTNDGIHTTRHADIAAGLSLSALGVL